MLLRMIISNVRKELGKINFPVDDIYVEKVNEGVAVLNASNGEKRFVIEYYEDGCSSLVERYSNFTKFGIRVVEFVKFSDKIIIYSDVSENSAYRLLEENDFMDKNIVLGIASLYKKLASISDVFMCDYNELFNEKSIKLVMDYFNWNSDKTMSYICNNFNNIKLKLNRIKSGVCVRKFNLNNMVVSKENNEICLSNLMNIHRCYCYKEIREILRYINEENRRDFIREIGCFTKEDELLDYIVSSVVELYLCAIGENSVESSHEYIERVSSGKLFECSKTLVEWY